MTDELPMEWVQFGIPDVPYSQVRLPLNEEGEVDFDFHMARLFEFRRAYLAAFAPDEPQDAPESPPQRQPVRNTAPVQSNGPRPAQKAQGNPYGITLKCPEHGDVLRPSVRNKTMDWDEELQRDIPASWFHTAPDGSTCSVYRSRAVRA